MHEPATGVRTPVVLDALNKRRRGQQPDPFEFCGSALPDPAARELNDFSTFQELFEVARGNTGTARCPKANVRGLECDDGRDLPPPDTQLRGRGFEPSGCLISKAISNGARVAGVISEER
jgi:hypothetical protein